MSVTLADQRERLETRLEDGWNRIAAGEAEGRDVRSWESLWYGLLSEYQSVCREIDAMRATPPTAPQPPGNEQQASLMSRGSGW